jgi:hypothetical protein
MNTGGAAPLKVHDVPVIYKLFHDVVAFLGGVGGFDQVAVHMIRLHK